MLLLLVMIRAGDANIVQVNKTVWQLICNFVVESFENLGRIAESKWNFKEFKSSQGVIMEALEVSAGYCELMTRPH